MTPNPDDDGALGPLAGDLAAAALTLARRFASGATLWCWAPNALPHAQHVAVEFVHPVIVGKRALPAVALIPEGPAAVGILRSMVRSGDVILVIGAKATDHTTTALMRRASSWGATTIWIGAGDRPRAGFADHVLFVAADAALAAHDGSLVLVYHLLWELTHVCFEHPGLLLDDLPDGAAPVCTTCSDEGILAEIVQADAVTATVRTANGVEQVDTTLVGDVCPGDLVLVHAGSALTIVDDRQ